MNHLILNVVFVPPSALVLVGIATGAGILVLTYEVSDYWENTKLVKEIQEKTNRINLQRNHLLQSYDAGEKTRDECIRDLTELLVEAETHLKFIKDQVSFLNMSHNYKNIKQIIKHIEEDLDFLNKL
ncbi:hypothetical protein C6988_09755 [Nitrosopumilus sp. b1]|uniref:hypothetical protein n=1 Tax=Nitrosopumilus sp. b1 TaxID=2109907 RepID=UPI0015F4DBC5|nr:hypothetical protein [Nitrosopumilus sp. b1]KAF6242191.1 hypothetical protein C6988_09755 [Nitrosopumilus sp. b1]